MSENIKLIELKEKYIFERNLLNEMVKRPRLHKNNILRQSKIVDGIFNDMEKVKIRKEGNI